MKKATARKADKNSTLRIAAQPGKSDAARLADIALDPAASNMATVQLFAKGTFGELSVGDVYEGMLNKVGAVRNGNMSGPEAVLVAQATSLNLIFTELARRSAANMGEYIEASERYMRLALKAQAQCRATIETLSTIKNPPVVIARQANVAAGPQQINNHTAAGAASSRGQLSEVVPNELLEAHGVEGERLESRTARAPASCDPALEAVGVVNRTEERRRQGTSQPQCI